MEYHWQYMELVDLCYLGGGQQCLKDCMNLLLKEIILKNSERLINLESGGRFSLMRNSPDNC